MRYNSIKSKFKAEYQALKNAIDRCRRPTHSQYDDYGGRGITVSDEFLCPVTGFATFLADVGRKKDPSLTLERKCNDKGYEPGNLEWTTRSANQLNRRKPKARARNHGWGVGYYKGVRADGKNYTAHSPLIQYAGKTQTIRHWADETGLSTHVITQRLLKGWPLADVLNPLLLNPQRRPRKDQTIH